MTKPAAPLVGRERELDQLESMLDEVASGSARILIVSGEPGIGKSRLLEELIRRGDSRDCRAFEGSAPEFERELPFGPFVDAFDPYLESLDTRTAERVAGDAVIELATVFPALHSLIPDLSAPGMADERYRAHRAVRELLERLAKAAPLVLALDDLHWADDASIELVSHLIRKPPRGRVALAAAFRSGQIPLRLVAAIEDADRAHGLERVELGPLSAADARRLVEDIDDAGLERLYAESGGNPFYLEQLARVQRPVDGPRGATRSVTEADPDIPPAVVGAIIRELDHLSVPARSLAEAAAVAGDPFELDLAAEIGALGEADVLIALDELLDGGLVGATSVPRRFRFRHPLVRHAIYEACGAGWRLGAHRRAAGALQRRGASVVERAHHIEASARLGDEEAVALLREAGEAVARRAPATAARWFEAALRLATEVPDSRGARVELLESLGSSLGAAGRIVESHAALLEALELLPDDAHAQRVALLTICGSLEALMGRQESARQRLHRALRDIPPDRSREAVRLRILLAVTSVYADDFERMRYEAEEALSAANALSDRSLQGYARAIVAYAAYRRGLIGEARAQLDRAIADCADPAAGEPAAADLFVFVAVGSLSRYLERYEDAGRLLARGIDLSRSTQQGLFLLPLLGAQAATAAALGNVNEAQRLSEDALDAARLAGNAMGEMMALRGRSWAAYLAGDMRTALAAGEQSLAPRPSVEESYLSAGVPIGLASALVETGAHQRAAELIGDAGGPELGDTPIADRCLSYELLARAALARDRAAEAGECADRAEAVAAETGLPVSTCYARRTRAALLLASGDAAGAVTAATEAAQAAEGAAARVEAARSRLLAGRALAAAGERKRAIAELDRAGRALSESGCDGFRQEASRELRKLGRRVSARSRPGRPDSSGIESLSGRELEVAGLVVDRRTNAEIAAELFLSPKTIETHMRNIFRKLGVSSRVELARFVEAAREPPTG
jgi:DNA-binding CsgD family transcriptional regulator/tetratricopeptide (TPR) repeat protein